MKTNRIDLALNDKGLTFDFDEWVALYEADPDEFDQRCLRWNKSIVKSASVQYQRRLAGLLFQINMEKARSKNALDSCIHLSGLMWDTFHQLKTELQGFIQQSEINRPPVSDSLLHYNGAPIKSAQILAFPDTFKLKK